MKEHGVDLRNEQAIRAKQAMQDIHKKQLEELEHGHREFLAMVKVWHEARESGDYEMAERVDSILDSMHYKDEEFALKCEIYSNEKMKEYGVDLEDEQAQKTIRAMLEVYEKQMEMLLTWGEELREAACAHTELLKGTK